jgi:hypothetical protein
VPVKYLGQRLFIVAKLSPTDAAKLNIPVNASLTEIHQKISTDIKTAVTNLTNQLYNKKERLLTQEFCF